MLVVINSAKTQHYAPLTDVPCYQPLLGAEVKKLVDRCRQLSKDDLSTIMKISEKLAESTYQRFQDFTFPHHETTASPALTAFAGDIFSEIHCNDFHRDDFLFAQQKLRILSGLYGILRPLDLIQPHRLEMGYKIGAGNAATLYDFWSESITAQLNEDLLQTGSSVLLNGASKEYSRAILTKKLEGSMLNLSFKQKKGGRIRSIAIYSKRARGMFVDWFVVNRVAEQEMLREFDRGGYRFVEELSSTTELCFVTDLDS